MGTERACIIGAGSSGIVAAKILHERGLPFDCYEKGSGIGGNWRYLNDNGLSAAYESLHINTSRDRMAYADFPMPDHYPDFAHHTQVLVYFEDYVDHFGFRDTLTFRTEVLRVVPAGDGAYDVTVRHLDQGVTRTERYGAVLVANGHHWDPNWPDFPGVFDGPVMHSHQYKTSDQIKDQRVLVVGVGNSACDIACEAARVARAALLSTRKGAHVVPKYMLGRPLDTFTTPLTARLPFRLQRLMAQGLLWLARGSQARYGFPTPDHSFGAEHPTISSDLLDLVGRGRIDVRPNVERLLGRRVRFTDGSEAEVDLIVYATGYNITFPFFDETFLKADQNRLAVYRHVAPPAHPNLYFVGLLQPLGAVMPLAEAQSHWIADLLEGKVGLPPRAAMWAAIEKEEEAMQRRYVASKRHTMQVDFFPYKQAIERERKQGRKHPPKQALPASSAPDARHPAPHQADLVPPAKPAHAPLGNRETIP